MRDLRDAVRGLRRQWPMAVAAIATVAIGIGAVATVGSLADAVLFRPYAYHDPDRLVLVLAHDPRRGTTPVAPSLGDYLDLRDRTRSLAALAAFVTLPYNLPGDGSNPALPLHVNFVSAGLLTSLGVSPVLGRAFTHAEEEPGADLFGVVISHDLWTRRFGSDPDVVGRTIRLDTTPYTVIGVMPPGFRFGYAFAPNADAWAPLESWLARFGETLRGQPRDGRDYYRVLARLAPGVTAAQADDDLRRLSAELAAEFPSTNRDVRFVWQSLREAESGVVAPYLRLVSAVVALLLLMATATVSGLLLVRATARRGEVAARLALGASRGALLRQWLAEGLVIGVAGAAVGAVLAVYAVRLIDASIPVERPVWMQFTVDWRLAGLAMLLGVAVGAVLGLLPAWVASQVPVADVLRESGRTGHAGAGGLRRALVTAQVALAAVLLVSGGVLLRSLWQLTVTPVGINPERLVTAYVSPPGDKYRDEDDLPAYASLYRRVLERLRALPDVDAAGGMNVLPFDGEGMPGEGVVLTREGDTVESQRGTPSVVMVRASHDAFAVAGIPLLQGQTFREDDTRRRPLVAIASRTLAARFWPGEDPIGRRVKPLAADQPGDWYTIIGVVDDVRFHGASRPALPTLYRPYTQVAAGSFHFMVRLRPTAPDTTLDTVRRTIADIDADVAVYRVQPFATRLAHANWQARLWALVCAVFAGTALLLAALGVYGVTATAVTQRQREFGVRLALGARPADIVRLVQRDVSRLVGLGLAAGLATAAWLLPLADRVLANVSPRDGLTFTIVAVGMAAVGLVAGWVPARRAGQSDPAETLRSTP